MSRQSILLCTLGITLYVLAFVVVHRSHTLRLPATNLAYWYYSDNDVVEEIEFYGFWPLRQATYVLFPGYAQHNSERRSSLTIAHARP